MVSDKTKRRMLFVALAIMFLEVVLPMAISLVGEELFIFSYFLDTTVRAWLLTVAIIIMVYLNWERLKKGFKGVTKGDF